MNKEDPTQGILHWLQPFTDNPENLETHVPAHSSETENSDSEGDISKVGTQKTEAQYLYSLPQRPKLRHTLEKPKLRGFLAEDAMRDLFHEQKSLVT